MRKIFVALVAFIWLSLCGLVSDISKADSSRDNNSNRGDMSGIIMINISAIKEIFGLRVDFPSGIVRDSYRQKKTKYDDDGVTYGTVNEAYYAFLQAGREMDMLEYRYRLKEKLQNMLRGYDLSLLKDLYMAAKENPCSGPFGRLEKGFQDEKRAEGIGIDHFVPNRQLTYAMYSPSPFISFTKYGIMINLRTMEVSDPFSPDEVEDFEWSPNGQFIAYSYAAPGEHDGDGLVVKNVTNNETIFRKRLGRAIAHFTWCPQSKYIAVLNASHRLSLLPWDLVKLLAGHAVSYCDFYLEVYDRQGARTYMNKLIDDVKCGSGGVVWVDNQ